MMTMMMVMVVMMPLVVLGGGGAHERQQQVVPVPPHAHLHEVVRRPEAGAGALAARARRQHAVQHLLAWQQTNRALVQTTVAVIVER